MAAAVGVVASLMVASVLRTVAANAAVAPTASAAISISAPQTVESAIAGRAE
jgi:hypothetical protein